MAEVERRVAEAERWGAEVQSQREIGACAETERWVAEVQRWVAEAERWVAEAERWVVEAEGWVAEAERLTELR